MSVQQRNICRWTWFAAGILVGGAVFSSFGVANAGDRELQQPIDARAQRMEIVTELKKLNATSLQMAESLRAIQKNQAKPASRE
ncbi:MAG: hypothetical protein AB7N71_03200 [Phycisphaerae bacterium]